MWVAQTDKDVKPSELAPGEKGELGERVTLYRGWRTGWGRVPGVALGWYIRVQRTLCIVAPERQ